MGGLTTTTTPARLETQNVAMTRSWCQDGLTDHQLQSDFHMAYQEDTLTYIGTFANTMAPRQSGWPGGPDNFGPTIAQYLRLKLLLLLLLLYNVWYSISALRGSNFAPSDDFYVIQTTEFLLVGRIPG